ncbi:ferrous iron transport protein A [Gammaproteobacteria bacterium ESL0073]|uniref:Ferrous iron transport protein A n=1 Tax=Entomomonas moraniae TaxID=2213226 RepID=A0A3Q9JKV2_9GAMM|nr:FeoA family protein [Entomomonas moraniae]AWM81205.1 ferrous iron transport protein A [Gammaproteobacteria bacterium ESL0073]AZS51966.1 ferrous iron transport protein A [Entomomonas moraniae]
MSSHVNVQIPLPLAPRNQKLQVVNVTGRTETVKKLSSMGIMPNTMVEILQSADGNLIIGVGNSRIAIASSLAQKIIVQPN